MGDEGNIMAYNGGTVLAMAGKNCVAIGTDLRFGIQNQTVTMQFPKVFRQGSHCFVGCSGLATDVQTLFERIRYRANLYQLREEREIKPAALASMISSLLYERRFGPYFTEPIVAGLDDNNEPFLSGMDLIGAPVFAKDFVATGTGIEGICGTCESLWKPDLEPDDLS